MSHKPRKRFGQHFLADDHVLAQIIKHIAPKPDDTLFEIGPGQGALTDHLVDHCKQMILFEIDRDLISFLESKLPPHCHLYQGDAATMALPEAFEQNRSLRLVGNLPYNVAMPILFRFIRHPAIIDVHIMVQKEVAERLVARPGSKTYGRSSIMAQYHSDVEYLMTIPPEAFSPPPKVDSAVVRLTRRPPPLKALDEKTLHDIVQKSFSQRRKMLRKIWRDLPPKIWKDLSLDAQNRPEQCPLTTFVEMANWIREHQIKY